MSKGTKERAAKKAPPTVADYLIVADQIIDLSGRLRSQFGITHKTDRDAADGMDAVLWNIFNKMEAAIQQDHAARKAMVAALTAREQSGEGR